MDGWVDGWMVRWMGKWMALHILVCKGRIQNGAVLTVHQGSLLWALPDGLSCSSFLWVLFLGITFKILLFGCQSVHICVHLSLPFVVPSHILHMIVSLFYNLNFHICILFIS
jgi:hypothetical protein